MASFTFSGPNGPTRYGIFPYRRLINLPVCEAKNPLDPQYLLRYIKPAQKRVLINPAPAHRPRNDCDPDLARRAADADRGLSLIGWASEMPLTGRTPCHRKETPNPSSEVSA